VHSNHILLLTFHEASKNGWRFGKILSRGDAVPVWVTMIGKGKDILERW
jgi:hypothetical protein